MREAEGHYYVECAPTRVPCSRCLGIDSSVCPEGRLQVALSGVEARLLIGKYHEFDARENFRRSNFAGGGLPKKADPKGAQSWEDSIEKFYRLYWLKFLILPIRLLY